MERTIASLDESGDAGRKPGQGSSELLVVALVVFNDDRAVEHCRVTIQSLRAALGKAANFEFHFHGNGHPDRLAFLRTVRGLEFTYHSAIVRKTRPPLPPSALYALACSRTLEAARPNLRRATIVLDGSGDRRSRQLLGSAVRLAAVDARDAIAMVMVHRSRSDDALQLADYVAGIVHRRAQQKQGANEYYRLIAHHEGSARVW